VEQRKEEAVYQGLTCPRCHQAAHVQKVSAIVSSGISNIRLSGATVGATYDLTGSGGLGVGAAHTTLSGNQQSLLAQRLAPPVRPEAKFLGYKWVFMTIVFVPIASLIGTVVNAKFGGLVFAIGALIYVCVGAYKEWKAAKDCKHIEVPYWEKQMAKWKERYYCHHCDYTFTPDEQSPLSSTTGPPLDTLAPSPLPTRRTLIGYIPDRCQSCGSKRMLTLTEDKYYFCEKCGKEYELVEVAAKPRNI
jgi:hypothetical protein